jgi:hypothetical protein
MDMCYSKGLRVPRNLPQMAHHNTCLTRHTQLTRITHTRWKLRPLRLHPRPKAHPPVPLATSPDTPLSASRTCRTHTRSSLTPHRPANARSRKQSLTQRREVRGRNCPIPPTPLPSSIRYGARNNPAMTLNPYYPGCLQDYHS